MKFILSLFVIYLLGVSALLAQDAPTRLGKSPTPSDIPVEPTPLPKLSITPEPIATPILQPSATASPFPETTPTATPTPERKRRRAARAKATPTPEKVMEKTETPAANAENHPAPVPQNRSWFATRSVTGKLKALEKEWESSFNNPVTIEKCVADDFVGTSPTGQVMTKKDLLREAKENPNPPPQTTTHDMDVHLHGTDLAVVTGEATQLSRNAGGNVVAHSFRFTDTWVLRDGDWKCVASQSMLAR
jgi:ketosteroid isomerase-like protein